MLFSASTTEAFMSSGAINDCLSYENFKRGRGNKSNGYTFTLLYTCFRGNYHDFYIKMTGMNREGTVTFKKKIYVDAIGPRGELNYFLRGFDKTKDRVTKYFIFRMYRPADTREVE